MCPSLIEIGSDGWEKLCTNKQTNKQTDTTKIVVSWPWTNYRPNIKLIALSISWLSNFVSCYSIISSSKVPGLQPGVSRMPRVWIRDSAITYGRSPSAMTHRCGPYDVTRGDVTRWRRQLGKILRESTSTKRTGGRCANDHDWPPLTTIDRCNEAVNWAPTASVRL